MLKFVLTGESLNVNKKNATCEKHCSHHDCNEVLNKN